jgi:hypothetical protein
MAKTQCESGPFRFFDLPIAIRNHVYRYAVGLHVVHLMAAPSRDHDRVLFVFITCDGAATTVEQWDAGNTRATPRCRYVSFNHSSWERLSISLLLCSKRMHEEAARMMFQANIIHFKDFKPLKDFLLEDPGLSFRKETLTKLAITISPRSRDTHHWNSTLGELYLPHGTMTSPDPHFPALKQLQLYLTNDATPWPDIEGGRWTSPIWIWGFMYFALENLESVSVVGDNYRIEDPAASGGWRFVSEEEERVYEEMVKGRLLEEWIGGEQDDVELMHTTYYMKTRDCEWGEEGDGAQPWGERQ